MEYLGAVLGIFGAVIGAIVGAWSARRLGTPKPIITVDQLEMTSSTTRWTSGVTIPNKALINTIEENPLLQVKMMFSGKAEERRMTETKYIEFLHRSLRDIDEVTNVLASAREVATRFREHLATDDYESFERMWSREQISLWRLLSAACLQGDVAYAEEADPAPEKEAHKLIPEPEEQGSYRVSLPGHYTDLLFDSSADLGSNTHPPDKQKLQDFARRTAEAFAYHRREDLATIVRFLLDRSNYENVLAELRSNVENELRAHHRLIVRGQISNTGGSPFSVANKAKVFVQTQGYPFIHVEPDGTRSQRSYPKNMELYVHLGTSEKAYESPFVIESGRVQRFTAISEQRIKEIDQRDVLRSAFEGGERKYYLGALVILPGRRPLRPRYTTPQLFRDWKTQIDIPAKG
jgi:hypothetical protein